MEFDEEIYNKANMVPKSWPNNLKFGLKFNIVFVLSGLLGSIEMVLQIIFSVSSENAIYFFSCILFGPFNLIAICLLLSLSKLIF